MARYYDIHLEKDAASGNANTLVWTRIIPTEDTLPGVYCLRTNQPDWDERTLWNIYTMLTDPEAVFRSLKSELGLRPIYHRKSARVDGHLFISVLAYHLVHTLRIRLKAQGIHLSWESLRNQFAGQERVTVVLHRDDGQIDHIRKATAPNPTNRSSTTPWVYPTCRARPRRHSSTRAPRFLKWSDQHCRDKLLTR